MAKSGTKGKKAQPKVTAKSAGAKKVKAKAKKR